LETGLTVFNTLLPLVRGQRIGLFAGSGVGKSTLLGRLATGVQADVVVIAMVGERGREVREFVEKIIGPDQMKRTIVVAATSEQSALSRKRCAATAMTIAEHFRESGLHVLYLADSVTRMADAHREIALATGEKGSLRGYPPSTPDEISRLCERAGPGQENEGDITAIFSVLVAGSDMEEPVADILRGVLDGHVVLDRSIAERGRFPAVDVLRSVSRSLPRAATNEENDLISRARFLLGTYANAEMMLKAGLYAEGSDPDVDLAKAVWSSLDKFVGLTEKEDIENSFKSLAACLVPSEDSKS
jgi:flagellum-specific ATP synthase